MLTAERLASLSKGERRRLHRRYDEIEATRRALPGKDGAE